MRQAKLVISVFSQLTIGYLCDTLETLEEGVGVYKIVFSFEIIGPINIVKDYAERKASFNWKTLYI